jgi:IclR family acetate operon transcriptional repressor
VQVLEMGPKTARHNAEALTAIGKVVAVVEALTTKSKLSSIAEATELATSTVHRILHELVEIGWASGDGERGYTLGPRFLALSARVGHGAPLLRVAPTIMRRMRESTGHTVHLAIRQGDEAVYIAKVDGKGAYQMRSHVGLTVPLHCTAVGKALLALLPEEEVRAIISRTGLSRRTDNTITSVEAFLSHLATVKRRGFAADEEENEATVRCVGAAVTDAQNYPVAAVSLSWLSFEVQAATLQRSTKMVLGAAKHMSQALAGGFLP